MSSAAGFQLTSSSWTCVVVLAGCGECQGVNDMLMYIATYSCARGRHVVCKVDMVASLKYGVTVIQSYGTFSLLQ